MYRDTNKGGHYQMIVKWSSSNHHLEGLWILRASLKAFKKKKSQCEKMLEEAKVSHFQRQRKRLVMALTSFSNPDVDSLCDSSCLAYYWSLVLSPSLTITASELIPWDKMLCLLSSSQEKLVDDGVKNTHCMWLMSAAFPLTSTPNEVRWADGNKTAITQAVWLSH